MKKVCIVTGTRAEYGLLKPLIQKVYRDEELELELIVTGMHLSPEFGLTYQQIEEDGYPITQKVEILLSSDTPVGVSKSIGLGMISFAETYERLQPDVIVVLGDRYEIFAAASAAMCGRIPLAHIHGGELTEGMVDEAIRHAITKMSYLHFTSTESYRKRVIQLGEEPNRVFNVGAIGIENIRNMQLLSKKELEEAIGFAFDKEVAMITYHPVTLEDNTAKKQIQTLLQVLDEFSDMKFIFTKANSDVGGRIINQMIDEYVEKNKNKAIAFTSMGQLRYLSSVKYSSVVIGNSSSGIIEVPSLGVPTVNIGDRQKGRIGGESIINCDETAASIKRAIEHAREMQFRKKIKEMVNPYEKANVSEQILIQLKHLLFKEKYTLKKKFYDLNEYKKINCDSSQL